MYDELGFFIFNVVILVKDCYYDVIIVSSGDFWCFLIFGNYDVIVFVLGWKDVILNV